jgi:hypothetical protein
LRKLKWLIKSLCIQHKQINSANSLLEHKYTQPHKERNVLHPATGDPSDQVDDHTARVLAINPKTGQQHGTLGPASLQMLEDLMTDTVSTLST